MSTRSMIGFDTPEGGRYLYCHSDGYPTWVGNALRAIIDRDGAGKAIAALFKEGAQGGWSCLRPTAGDEEPHISHGETIPGYGVAYRDLQDYEPCTLSDALMEPGIEYIYSIRPNGSIDIYECGVGCAWRWRLAPGAYSESDERPALTTPITLTTETTISEAAGA